jgi:transcriptional regulator with XRE-family HTH domain
MSIQKDDRRPEHVAQYISEASGEAAPAVETEPPANTKTLAEALGVDRDRLLRFVRDHPNPTAGYVLGWAGAEPDLREDVAEWLEAYGSAADRWEVSAE